MRETRSLKSRIDERRTLAMRVADRASEAFGSNWFLIGNLIWFLVWGVLNTKIIPGLPAFDPFPFGLLTVIVSLEAIVLSIFVLISQNRAERVDELRAEVALQVSVICEAEITKILGIVTEMARRQGVKFEDDQELAEMLEPTNVEKLERVLDEEIGDSNILA